MKHRKTAAAAIALAALTLSACGSGGPGSIKDLRTDIEKSGYTCLDPEKDEKSGSFELSCGDDVYAYWYKSAAEEVAAYDTLVNIYTDVPGFMPITDYAIRGEKWRIGGDEHALKKVANTMGEEVVTVGNH